jgi:prepilin-type processing-associated H-X9-DG protein
VVVRRSIPLLAVTRSTPRVGFTLVELLVVIGIIVVLIAVLMPALAKVRKHAQEVHCAANLRSIGQALTMYTQQYGCYPGCFIAEAGDSYSVWPVRLRPFLGGEQGVFVCPARDERFDWPKVAPESGIGRAAAFQAGYGYEVGEPLLSAWGRRFSYGYNAWGVNSGVDSKGLGGQVNTNGIVPHARPGFWKEPRASGVKSPSQMIAITDSDGDGMDDFLTSPLLVIDARGTGREMPGDVHRRGANVLFCDAHVQWHRQKDLLVTYEANYPEEMPIRRMWKSDHMP